MRVLTAPEQQLVSAGSNDEFFEIVAEIMIEICYEVFVQLIAEIIIQGTINGIRSIHDYYYPPQVVMTSHFRPVT